jgi:NADPH:quinone reductase-like Zn-dependent oxidoreductase
MGVGPLGGSLGVLYGGLVLRTRLHLIGTVLRTRPPEEKIALAREFSDHVLPLFSAGRVRPIVDRVFAFGEIAAAHRHMEENQTFGKIVLRW